VNILLPLAILYQQNSAPRPSLLKEHVQRAVRDGRLPSPLNLGLNKRKLDRRPRFNGSTKRDAISSHGSKKSTPKSKSRNSRKKGSADPSLQPLDVRFE
jgi:hypothetical protein